MQKKLYFLDEEEKNRILNLHKSRTKKQYILGEGSEEGEISTYTAQQKTSTPKSSTPSLETQFWNSKGGRVIKLRNKCTDTKFNSNDPVFKELYNWMIDKGGSSLGWDWAPLPGILKKIKTIKQYCEISNSLRKGDDRYMSQYNYSLGDWLWTKIKSEKSWTKYFEKPLVSVLKDAGLETLDSNGAHKKEVEKKSIEMPDKKTSPITQQKKWYVLNKKYSDKIKSALNLDTTTMLSDSDIKSIYDKLIQKGIIK